MELDITSLGNAVRRLREGLARYEREPADEFGVLHTAHAVLHPHRTPLEAAELYTNEFVPTEAEFVPPQNA